jgi:glycosyltransferase involved in cell wall biosynthesis
MTDPNVIIVYLSPSKPNIKASMIQTIKTCEYLSNNGAKVYLFIRARSLDFINYKKFIKNIRKIFNVKGNSILIPIWMPMPIFNNRILQFIAVTITLGLFAFVSSLFIALLKILEQKPLLVYIRTPKMLLIFYILKPLHWTNTIYEVHQDRDLFSTKKLKTVLYKALTSSTLIVSISKYLTEKVKRKLEIIYDKIVTLHDAFDDTVFSRYSNNISTKVLREELRLPVDKFIVAYVGQVWRWKRIEFLIDAFELLNSSDVILLIVGGPKNELQFLRRYARTKQNSNNIIIKGPVLPMDVPKYLLAADCLVHYTPSSGPMKSYSPLKIFEYMAAGKPILAPRQPWIEEVLKDGENALLFDEDSPKDLAEKIELIKNNPELADRIAKNAKQQSAKHTYQERAKRLLEYLNQLTT